jgi:transcriptional regulator with GAF, ATPase, and Fis domain
MSFGCWVHAWGDASEQDRDALRRELSSRGATVETFRPNTAQRSGVCIFSGVTPELRDFLQLVSGVGQERVIAIAGSGTSLDRIAYWNLLQAGASDVLSWSNPDRLSRQIAARFERWSSVERLMAEPKVVEFVVAKSLAWRKTLRDVVEIARFSDATVLILGETGTGKEVIARLVHLLDSRLSKRDLVVLDCSTVVPELSGSEFFGHERGAFTGALTERHGAFALANGGTLFLDEVGELPLPMQAQLLRVIHERTYKRLGGSTWHRTTFRLLCATNRDLAELVRRGAFRADLYYRIAGCVCRLPPLRERLEDIIPLAEHFLRQAYSEDEPPELDDAVRDYLLRREYPGNVRDLQQTVSRLMYRLTNDRMISIGCVPANERPVLQSDETTWHRHFEVPIQRAVLSGVALKEIGRAAEDAAIRCATDVEDGNLQRAARRLGVTDRALQLRRASRRQNEGIQPEAHRMRNDLEESSRDSASAVFRGS